MVLVFSYISKFWHFIVAEFSAAIDLSFQNMAIFPLKTHIFSTPSIQPQI